MEKIKELQLLIDALNNRYKQFEAVYMYDGVFDKDIISLYSKKITALTKYNPRAQKRLFTVFIELAQNVAYYSNERKKIADDNETGVGGLIIGETPECFYFMIGNNIKDKPLEVLSKKCEIINSLDREELREYKRQQRNLIPGTNGGAHIGLILVSLTTKRPLNIRVYKIENSHDFLFTIVVEVDKVKTSASNDDD